MVEESRRSHLANRLPCPQSGFRDFRGTKRRAVYWRSECHEYTKTAPRVAAPSGCLRQGDMRPNQARPVETLTLLIERVNVSCGSAETCLP